MAPTLEPTVIRGVYVNVPGPHELDANSMDELASAFGLQANLGLSSSALAPQFPEAYPGQFLVFKSVPSTVVGN